jgi:hypothetical protein
MLHRTKTFNTQLYLSTYNRGAVLIVSLLLLSILTMLSLTVMDDSHLVFKSQAVRLQHQRAIYRADKINALVHKAIESYLPLRDWAAATLPSGLSLDTKGQDYFETMLSRSSFSSQPKEQVSSEIETNLVRLFRYDADGVVADISLIQRYKVRNISGSAVMQHRSYDGISSAAGEQGSTTLYFEIHCVVELSRGNVAAQKAYTISDYRLHF